MLVLVLALLFATVNSQDCTGDEKYGEYRVTWKAFASSVQFNASVVADNGTWIALGFSVDMNMIRSDIVVGSLNVGIGTYFVEDRFAIARRMPIYDEIQNIRDTSISVEDGVMKMSFIRDINTEDSANDVSLDTCTFLLVAWGGVVTSYNTPSQFGKHTQKSVIQKPICIKECKEGFYSDRSITTSSPDTAPPATSDNGGGGGLSLTYIIIIVIGCLIAVVVILLVALAAVCFLTRKSGDVAGSYELNAAPAPHPVTQRETTTKDTSHIVHIPVNEYNTESFPDENLYDKVASEEPAKHNAHPDGFFDSSEPAALYDEPPAKHDAQPGGVFDSSEPSATLYDEPPLEQPRIPRQQHDEYYEFVQNPPVHSN